MDDIELQLGFVPGSQGVLLRLDAQLLVLLTMLEALVESSDHRDALELPELVALGPSAESDPLARLEAEQAAIALEARVRANEASTAEIVSATLAAALEGAREAGATLVEIEIDPEHTELWFQHLNRAWVALRAKEIALTEGKIVLGEGQGMGAALDAGLAELLGAPQEPSATELEEHVPLGMLTAMVGFFSQQLLELLD